MDFFLLISSFFSAAGENFENSGLARGQISSIFDVGLKINLFKNNAVIRGVFLRKRAKKRKKRKRKTEGGRVKKSGILRKAERGSGSGSIPGVQLVIRVEKLRDCASHIRMREGDSSQNAVILKNMRRSVSPNLTSKWRLITKLIWPL